MYTKRTESRREQMRSFKTLVMTVDYILGLLYGPSFGEPILPPIPWDLNQTNPSNLCLHSGPSLAH